MVDSLRFLRAWRFRTPFYDPVYYCTHDGCDTNRNSLSSSVLYACHLVDDSVCTSWSITRHSWYTYWCPMFWHCRPVLLSVGLICFASLTWSVSLNYHVPLLRHYRSFLRFMDFTSERSIINVYGNTFISSIVHLKKHSTCLCDSTSR